MPLEILDRARTALAALNQGSGTKASPKVMTIIPPYDNVPNFTTYVSLTRVGSYLTDLTINEDGESYHRFSLVVRAPDETASQDATWDTWDSAVQIIRTLDFRQDNEATMATGKISNKPVHDIEAEFVIVESAPL